MRCRLCAGREHRVWSQDVFVWVAGRVGGRCGGETGGVSICVVLARVRACAKFLQAELLVRTEEPQRTHPTIGSLPCPYRVGPHYWNVVLAQCGAGSKLQCISKLTVARSARAKVSNILANGTRVRVITHMHSRAHILHTRIKRPISRDVIIPLF